MRRAEQAAMFAYGEDGRCLMQALQQELDDPRAEPCGRCAVCPAPRFDAPVDPGLARQAYALVRSQPIVLERAPPDAADGRPAGQEDRAGAPARGGSRARPRRATAAGTALVRQGRARRPLRRRARAGVRRSARPLAARPAAALGDRRAVAPLGRRSCRTSPRGSPRRSGCRTSTLLERVGRQPAAARDGELGAAGRERPRRSSAVVGAPAGRRRAARGRRALLGLDAREVGAQLRDEGRRAGASARAVARGRLRGRGVRHARAARRRPSETSAGPRAGGGPRQAGTGAGMAAPRRARRAAANSSPSPAAAHATSTANAEARSRAVEEPGAAAGGSRRRPAASGGPIAPAGSGSTGSHCRSPENGLPMRIIVSAAEGDTPAGPSNACKAGRRPTRAPVRPGSARRRS